ncbi:MAG TPA: class I SAM-dependent methyltransferase [Alphaproteobacteria bacterium]|nr:class I SAM-dependent methyltransferase [Alphaproteobacteria bacterium]
MQGSLPVCPICGAAMRSQRLSWLYRCGACGFLKAALSRRIESEASRAVVNESRRERGLNGLRLANFERILDRLQQVRGPDRNARGRALLDVGCAHGWFLDAAAARGFDAIGLEPDSSIAATAASGGRKIRSGFFPDDVPANERFDVISFNDVFEHLPDIEAAMAACARLLKPDGLLVLNVPCRRGVFYRLAAALERIGLAGPLERLWQIHFASPHFSYFAPVDLRRLAGRHGLMEIHRSSLPSVRLRGLWPRLSYDTTASTFSNAVIWLGVAIVSPFLALLPADISLQIFQRAADGRDDL